MVQAFASRGRLLYALAAFLLCFAALAVAGYFAAGAGGSRALSLGGSYIAMLEIEGPITASDVSPGFFSSAAMASSVSLCERLYGALEDDSVKGVLLRINSPGGSAAASDEIYRAVLALREAHKPVVVSMGDVAASGGYYIASAADYIFANGATLTGSIGVIFELINWDEAAKKLGIESETLHAGEYKDIGSPWREMTPKEREMLTGLLKQVHDQFIRAVDEGRGNLDEAQVRALATGMIFTGEAAKAAGLVDAVGGLEEAKAKARSLAGLPADAPVQGYGGSSFWEEFFASGLHAPAPQDLLRRVAGSGLEALAHNLCLNTSLRDLVVR